MATATISNWSEGHFPCHSTYTSIAVDMGSGNLGWVIGYDKGGYKNHYGQGVPITIPSDAASNVTSITITVTFHGYDGLNYGTPRTYYVCCLPNKYDTKATQTAQYNNIKGYTGQASFSSDYTGGSQTKTVTISGLSLAPGSTHYVYVHIGSYTTYACLHVVDSITVTCTYEESGKVRIYTSSGWVSATPWVYTSSGWVKAKPWVYTSSGWQRAK